jgi:hypothetical protein
MTVQPKSITKRMSLVEVIEQGGHSREDMIAARNKLNEMISASTAEVLRTFLNGSNPQLRDQIGFPDQLVKQE